jgi:hypothetical protein
MQPPLTADRMRKDAKALSGSTSCARLGSEAALFMAAYLYLDQDG